MIQRRGVPCALGATLWCLLNAAAAPAQDSAPPTLRVGPLSAEGRIDGVLDESDWGAAEAIDALTQTDPSEGATPTGRTIVRVLAGPKAIVIGIVCEDPDPSGIVSYSVRRDATLTSEDHNIRELLPEHWQLDSNQLLVKLQYALRY